MGVPGRRVFRSPSGSQIKEKNHGVQEVQLFEVQL
jgi:hypothetical protein